MLEYMTNFYDEIAVIDYSRESVGIITVRVEDMTREYEDVDSAVRFLEKLG